MNAVSIVTIKEIKPLFKGEDQANSIELILLEEVGFELVSQKGLYQVGDKAVYIQPDYNVSDIILFDSFIRPNGDEKKSMLGKVEGQPRRIRAKKFNFSTEPNGPVIYSNGILLPTIEVKEYLRDEKDIEFYIGEGFSAYEVDLEYLDLNLTKLLGITKYEEPEYTSKGGLKVGGAKVFPQGLYKTDEENINNLWNHIERKIGYPIVLVGTEKIDGSSITIGITQKNPEGLICSRNLSKSIIVKKVIGRRKKTLLEKLTFWKKVDLNIYQESLSDDDFVKNGIGYLEQLKGHGFTNHILRGELNGGSLKGSGNKNNPASKQPVNIKFFGLDIFDTKTNIAVKADYKTFKEILDKLGFDTVKTVFEKSFNSREELEKECKEYFKTNMIEGIVLRTLDSKFSAKFMNNEYDSKK